MNATDYPIPYITSERPPTKEDGDKFGMILAFFPAAGEWGKRPWNSLKENPIWLPLPPLPKEPWEVAFSRVKNECDSPHSEKRFREGYLAGEAAGKDTK